MRNASIRCHAGGPVAGTIGLVLGLLLAGCNQPAASPKAETPAAAESPSAATPVVAAVQPDVVSAPEATAAPASTPVAETSPAPAATKGDEETVQVGACDGGAAVEVSKDLKGQALADSLMDQWKRKHPEANWVTEEKERHALKPPADNSDLLQGEQGKGHPYGNYTEKDLLTWTRETEKFVAEGSRIFHSGDELSSSVGVSCDMCHPHAANTHPETYPKYQVQLGRVALLRDMINWCIENPVRGQKLAADSPEMRALEAYIQSQRKGVPLNYGKH
jgi:thiosulfate dehydrogenase